MRKEEIRQDRRLLAKLNECNIKIGEIRKYENCILTYLPESQIAILMDSNYNIFKVEKVGEIGNDFQMEMYANTSYFTYAKEKEIQQSKFTFPFGNYTLKDLIDLSSMIKVRDCSLTVSINGQQYKYDKSNDMKLLMFIEIIGECIKNYFIYQIHLNSINIATPDVREYINSLIRAINNIVKNSTDLESLIMDFRTIIGPSLTQQYDGCNKIRKILTVLMQNTPENLTPEVDKLKEMTKLPEIEVTEEEKSFDELKTWLKDETDQKTHHIKKGATK